MKNKVSIQERRRSFEKEYPNWEKTTLYERFVHLAGVCLEHPFFIDTRAHSYQEVERTVRRTIWCLLAQGVQKDDFVIVACGNRIEYIYLTFALAAIGAVKIPVNQNLGIAELEYIIRQSSPRLLIVEHIAMACAIKERVAPLKVIYLEHLENNAEIIVHSNKRDMLTWDKFFALEKYDVYTQIQTDPDRVVDVIYTSGSTGNPKGVLLTHDMLLRSAYASCLNRGFAFGWRIYVPLPLFHVYGYVEGLLAAMLAKGSIVVTEGKYNADSAIQAMNLWEVNDILSVPFIMADLLKSGKLENVSFSELYAVYCSASVCPEWIWKDIRDKLDIHEITTGYGMTEVCGATVQNSPDDSDEILSNYLGRVLDGGCAGNGGAIVRYRVLDLKTGKELPPGHPGELVCKGPVVTGGYLKEDEANKKAFDEEGWFHTGDVGCFTEDGYLKLSGRIADSYRINGENVSLHFLDLVISKCPEVIMVETVGIPDEKVGCVGVAFVEPISDDEDTHNRIVAYCRRELASYQIPAYFFFGKMEAWSKTAVGKIQKIQLMNIAVKNISEMKLKKHKEPENQQ
jgi:fatty-acyl-CoA synthase